MSESYNDLMKYLWDNIAKSYSSYFDGSREEIDKILEKSPNFLRFVSDISLAEKLANSARNEYKVINDKHR